MPRKGGQKKKTLKGRGAYYPGGVRGRGSYKGIAGALLGPAAALADTIVPGAGGVLSGVGSILGLGDYKVRRNTTYFASPVPSVHSSTDAGIRYRHKEYLGDLTGSDEWNVTQFRVNPGISEVFPWLSAIAGNFQKYRIDGLMFCLRSTSSVAIASSTNLSLGTVMGGFQYRATDTVPSCKQDFMALGGSISGKPSSDALYPMECDRGKNVFGNLLIRTGGVSDDIQKYDHAVFNLATVGFQDSYILGELWVTYDVLLMGPKTPSANGFLMFHGLAGCEDVAGETMALFPVSGSSGGAFSGVQFNTLGWKVSASSDGTPCFEVPAGTSVVLYMDAMASTTATVWEQGVTDFTLQAVALTNKAGFVFEPVPLTDYNWAQFESAAHQLVSDGSVYLLKTSTDSTTLVRFGWKCDNLVNQNPLNVRLRLMKAPDNVESVINGPANTSNVSGILRTPADVRAFTARSRARAAQLAAVRSASPGARLLSAPPQTIRVSLPAPEAAAAPEARGD